MTPVPTASAVLVREQKVSVSGSLRGTGREGPESASTAGVGKTTEQN